MNRAFVVLTAAAALWTVSALGGASAQAQAASDCSTVRMGVQPWLGYGLWHVAAARGLFEDNGLSDVELVNFTTDTDINAALASANLDVANLATHTTLAMVAAGLPVRIALLLDVSTTADAIIVDGSVESVPDLAGRSVAYEEGTTSDILLNYALAEHDMSIDDVRPVPMPAANAGTALIAGNVPAAVTYEPYLTLARQRNPDVRLLVTAGEAPGLISDVLVAREEVLEQCPEQMAALLRTWDQALTVYREHPAEGRAIIAEAVGAAPEDLATAFEGVEYYSLAENREQLRGAYANEVIPAVAEASADAGLLPAGMDLEGVIDGRPIDAATR